MDKINKIVEILKENQEEINYMDEDELENLANKILNSIEAKP